MIPFAVSHEGMEEGQGSWVLEVDPTSDRLLLADGDGSLHWHRLEDCRLIKVQTPDMPTAVIAVQPTGAQVVVPGNFPNREMRRNGHN